LLGPEAGRETAERWNAEGVGIVDMRAHDQLDEGTIDSGSIR
jgi:hypothetical protein